MTVSFWDDTEIVKQFSDCATLKDIIQRLETDFSGRGEVICEIRVNGVPLKEEDEARYSGSRREEIRELAVQSNSPADLINEAMASAREFIPRLTEACLKTAEDFRGSDVTVAQKNFIEVVEGCRWIVETIMHVGAASRNLGIPMARENEWIASEEPLVGTVREVSQAFQNRDFVLVADLLEYEVTAVLEKWRAILA